MATKYNIGNLPISWSLAIGLVVVVFMLTVTALPTENTTPEVRLTSDCTCIGDPLEFQCITIGPGATIWRGSTLNCPSSLNEIPLYHSRFASRTAAGSCNNGNIIARALDTTEGQYRSQLNIHNLTPEMNGTTVECLYDDGVNIYPIDSITIAITTERFPPPMNISLITVSKRQLHFSWNPIAPACSAIHYNINASNCGRCPNSTTSTSAICTDVEVEDAKELCSFGISTVVCSNVIGVQKEVDIMLSAPGITSITDVIPTYGEDTNHLMKLTTEFKPNITQENLWTRSTGTQDVIQFNSSVISYTINYTDSDTGRSCGNGTVSANSCTSGVCSHEFEIASSMCQHTNFAVKMFATNDLGDGANSDPIRRDLINHYVKVVVYPTREMISCEFLYKSKSGKSCSITYFDESCQKQLAISASAAADDYNTIILRYRDLPKNHSRYCYVIAASNGTMKVNITGSFIPEPDAIVYAPDKKIIILSTFFPVITVMGVVGIGIISIVYMYIMNCKGQRRSFKLKRK